MNAAFLARMEDVLAVCERADDPRFPVVCFDERPCVLHGQPVEPLPPVPAAQARALAARSEGHYTPKNASWFNMVELERSAIARQCLHQRIPTQDEPAAHIDACVAERNVRRASVRWQFSLDKARQKLTRHYQKVCADNSPD